MPDRISLDKVEAKLKRYIRWGSHVAIHRAILKSFPITGILELGAGLNSTKEFFSSGKLVVSIENDGDWIKKLRKILVENKDCKIIHHILSDCKIKRSTLYGLISEKIRFDAVDFYKQFITDKLNMLFIDNYAGFRMNALQSLYSKFDIVTFHDVEDSELYGYNLFKNDQNYIEYVDKSFIAYVGLLVKPKFASYISNFLDNFKIEVEKRSVELNVIANMNIVKL